MAVSSGYFLFYSKIYLLIRSFLGRTQQRRGGGWRLERDLLTSAWERMTSAFPVDNAQRGE
jgi:hypothetical protein